MLSKIEVGKTYRGVDTKRNRKVLFVGESLVVIKNHFGHEVSISIEDALKSWEEIPEELWVNYYPNERDTKFGMIHHSKFDAIESKSTGGITYRLVKE